MKEAIFRPGSFRSSWRSSPLMSLSIPRRILVDDEGLHILCLLDITELHRRDRLRTASREAGTPELRALFRRLRIFRVLRTLFRPEKSRKSKSTLPNGGISSKSPIYMKIGSMSPVPRRRTRKRPTGTHLARPRTTSTGATVPETTETR